MGADDDQERRILQFFKKNKEESQQLVYRYESVAKQMMELEEIDLDLV